MAANEYQFFTEWRLAAEQQMLFEILREGREYPRWWPDVYLGAKFLASGDPDHIGDRVELLTKGWLPYRLRWTAEVTRLEKFRMIAINASGDFNGQGIWNIDSNGQDAVITFDWRITADKPLLKFFSPLLKPLFSWNHEWAMATGLPRLKAEVARRKLLAGSVHN